MVDFFKESFYPKIKNYLSVFKLSRFTRKYISDTFFEMRTAWLLYILDTTGWVAILLDCHGIVGGLIVGPSVHKP